MRNAIMTVAAGAAMILISMGAVSAAPGSTTQLGVAAASESALKHVQYEESFCARLRDRCKFKYELGKSGDGNCRRYQEECGGGRESFCERLRHRCRSSYERGEEGDGSCRRYREECR